MVTFPDFLFLVSISTLCPNDSDISCSIFNISVSFCLDFGEFLDLFFKETLLRSFTVNLSLIIFLHIFSASEGGIDAKSFACPFSIFPSESKSRTDVGKDNILSELAIVLLALPVEDATSS